MTSQEQELLTRVARAMQASKAWPAVFDAGSAEVLARAAIEAMSEPTEAMRSAGEQYVNYGRYGADEVWGAMINAAISKGEE